MCTFCPGSVHNLGAPVRCLIYISTWQTAKEFVGKWKTFLKEIPSNFNKISISQDTADNKIKKIIELGTPAIPFIADEITLGKVELFPAIVELLKGNKVITIDNDISDKKAWVKLHKAEFENLRQLVMDQQ